MIFYGQHSKESKKNLVGNNNGLSKGAGSGVHTQEAVVFTLYISTMNNPNRKLRKKFNYNSIKRIS